MGQKSKFHLEVKNSFLRIFTLLLAIHICSFAQNYQNDSLAVKAILNAIGKNNVAVENVSTVHNGRIDTLRLAKLQITALPSDLANLTGLQSLNLDSNFLTTIPAGIFHLTALLRLQMQANRLTQIPDSISQLVELRILDLRHNELTSIPTVVSGLNKLVVLYLGDNRLQNLDTNFAIIQFDTVTYKIHPLDLSENRLCNLPTALKNWAQAFDPGWESKQYCAEYLNDSAVIRNVLNSLGLQDSSLSVYSRPSAGRIQTLRLVNKGLTLVPEALMQLTGLTSLFLDSNQLSTLPSTFSQLSNLKALSLMKNNFMTFPETITQLVNVKILVFSGNQIQALPNGVGNLRKMTTLVLNHNNLTTLPFEIGALNGLQILDIAANHLNSLPDEIVTLKPQILVLAGNPLCALSSLVTTWANTYAAGWAPANTCSTVILSQTSSKSEQIYWTKVAEGVRVSFPKPMQKATLYKIGGEKIVLPINGVKKEFLWKTSEWQVGLYFLQLQGENTSVTLRIPRF